MTETIATVVLGAGGYVGGEILRLIAGHPSFELSAAVSDSRTNQTIGSHFPALAHAYPKQSFESMTAMLAALDDKLGNNKTLALFSAAPHGASARVIAMVLAAAKQQSVTVHVVDSSADFRYRNAADFASIYGMAHPEEALLNQFDCVLPEHCTAATTPHIGHPGCFATASLLAAVPLFACNLAEPEVFISGITGSTGSGRQPTAGTHHPERHSNLYAYKPLSHRHAPEMVALIKNASQQDVDVHFIPHSGPFSRGIYVTLQAKLKPGINESDVRTAFRDYYNKSIFVSVLDGIPRLKDVVTSNYCHVGVSVSGEQAVVMSAIDNLVKGAAGGAMQWMNRLWSLPESTGLTAAAPAWT